MFTPRSTTPSTWSSLTLLFALSDEGRVRSTPEPSPGYLAQIQSCLEQDLEVACPTPMPAVFKGHAGLWFEIAVATLERPLVDGKSYRMLSVTFSGGEGTPVQTDEQLAEFAREVAAQVNDCWPQPSGLFSFVSSSHTATPLELEAVERLAA